MDFRETFTKLKQRVNQSSYSGGDQRDRIPMLPTDPQALASYMQQLYDDGKNFRSTFFFNRLNVIDPIMFWNYCHLLDTGDHWKVWGTRIKNKKDEWRAELVENEIGNQIRIKTAYLTANWHRFSVQPNIQNIDKIISQEQIETQWGKRIIEIVRRMCKYGSVIVKSYMDFDIDPNGVATEMVCDNSGIFVSPFSRDLSRSGSCYYVCHAMGKPKWYVLSRYGDSMKELGVLPSDIQTVAADKYRDIRGTSTTMLNDPKTSYRHAGLVDVMEFWIDDFEKEEVPHNPQEVSLGVQHLLSGEPPPVVPQQNHKKMVEGYMGYLADRNAMANSEETTDEDKQLLGDVNNVVAGQVSKHLQFDQSGTRLKYPFGRKIVVAGGKVVENVPNPFQFDWRRLFHWINFESVDGQLWGRGLCEILWQANKSLDLMKSRIADMGLNAVPEIWLPETNKRIIDRDGYNKEPGIIHYYTDSPPVYPQSRGPMEFLEIFKLDKEDARNAQGINNLTYGADPGADFSGKAINLLLSQNSIVVTGEANTNLSDGLERIIMTRLLMMKQFYTQARAYWINGQFVPVNVSKLLSEEPIYGEDNQPLLDEGGNPIMQAIPEIEITVVPSSNLPNQWERDLSVVVQLMNVPPQADGTPTVPLEALWDQLGERYAEFQPGGKYRVASKAMQIGIQEMQRQAQMQAQAQEAQKLHQEVAQSIVKKTLKNRMERYVPQDEPAEKE